MTPATQPRPRGRAMRGSMEIAIPLLMAAILGGVMLDYWWAALPQWAAWLAIIAVVATGLFGLILLRRPDGMAANWERSERETKRE